MPEPAIEAGGAPTDRPAAAWLASAGDAERLEPGSFRDRSARVFYRDGLVLRGLGKKAYADWLRLRQSAFFARLSGEGILVETEETSRAAADPGDAWAAVLRHDRIPFVSYPYEWCFDMLRDAAVLHLDLLLAALEEDFILKDASPFNVQWRGARPVFIDVTSFEPLAAGESWVAYRQFCQLFLYPLLLQAYKGVAFQPWLRGRIDGIGAEDCWRLMSLRDLVRPGVLVHVYLHARAQGNLASTERAVRQELREAGFGKETIQANVRRLRPLLTGLTAKAEETAWSHYGDNSGYAEEDAREKASFVDHVARSRDWQLVWDLGANTGTFAGLVARQARYVVAMDADQVAVGRLYQALREESVSNVLPLVVNLADPSPSLGWRGLERKSLPDRGRPDLTLCLALLHHLVIGANVPLPELVAWLAALGGDLVVEFVGRDDARVKQLLRNRVDQFHDYDLDVFEQSLSRHFEIVRRHPLPSGTRILYHAHRRPAS